MTQHFTHRRARSAALMATLGVLVAAETVAVHLLLARISVLLAVGISLLSLTMLLWFVADYRAFGARVSTLTDDELTLRIGRRVTVQIPRYLIKTIRVPTWRDTPETPDRTYLNATKPAEPNVLLTFSKPLEIRLPAGLRQSVIRLSFFVDDPESFFRHFPRAEELVATPARKASHSGGL